MCYEVTKLLLADEERIRKEVEEQYTIKIQEFELKVSTAEVKIKGEL